jgi:hypothetical protein
VYNADSHRRYHGDYEWHDEEVDDRVHLRVTVVRCHHDGFVLLGVEAGKHRALVAVGVGEVLALYARRIWRDETKEV